MYVCLQFQQQCNYSSEGDNYLDHTLSDHEMFKQTVFLFIIIRNTNTKMTKSS